MHVGCADISFDSCARVWWQLPEPGGFTQLSPSPAEPELSKANAPVRLSTPAWGAGWHPVGWRQGASCLAGHTGGKLVTQMDPELAWPLLGSGLGAEPRLDPTSQPPTAGLCCAGAACIRGRAFGKHVVVTKFNWQSSQS